MFLGVFSTLKKNFFSRMLRIRDRLLFMHEDSRLVDFCACALKTKNGVFTILRLMAWPGRFWLMEARRFEMCFDWLFLKYFFNNFHFKIELTIIFLKLTFLCFYMKFTVFISLSELKLIDLMFSFLVLVLVYICIRITLNLILQIP